MQCQLSFESSPYYGRRLKTQLILIRRARLQLQQFQSKNNIACTDAINIQDPYKLAITIHYGLGVRVAKGRFVNFRLGKILILLSMLLFKQRRADFYMT